MDFKSMTVKELKEESRKRGLTLESKGHKFTKSELIDRIMEYEYVNNSNTHVDADCVPEQLRDCTPTTPFASIYGVDAVNGCQNNDGDVRYTMEDVEKGFKAMAEAVGKSVSHIAGHYKSLGSSGECAFDTDPLTVDEVIERYGGRKPQHVYDRFLNVGSAVVFAVDIELPGGMIIKKLRTAKVVSVYRDDERVIVETIVGDTFALDFVDLIYIRPDITQGGYPRVIKNILKAQRTEKGKKLIEKRAGEIYGQH